MSINLLTSREAAEALGISVLTLYGWLSQSDHGEFMIRGEAVTINYFQGGRRGQGRIQIPTDEIDRLLSLMRVKTKLKPMRKAAGRSVEFPHIRVPLGLPDQ